MEEQRLGLVLAFVGQFWPLNLQSSTLAYREGHHGPEEEEAEQTLVLVSADFFLASLKVENQVSVLLLPISPHHFCTHRSCCIRLRHLIQLQITISCFDHLKLLLKMCYIYRIYKVKLGFLWQLLTRPYGMICTYVCSGVLRRSVKILLLENVLVAFSKLLTFSSLQPFLLLYP